MIFSSGISLKGKTVLIVEDDYVCSQLIKELLSDTGAEILHAMTGAKALEYVTSRERIDLIFMDIQLPDMNGLQASATIKTLNSSIPIIIQTAYAFESYMQKSKETGCDAFLVKPIDPQKMFDTIKKVMGKK